MGQIHPGFIADMLKHCERGEHPPLTVWEAQQLLTLAQRALSAPQASPAVAQVIEAQHDELEARIRWLLNPMPVGSVLYEEAASPAPQASQPPQGAATPVTRQWVIEHPDAAAWAIENLTKAVQAASPLPVPQEPSCPACNGTGVIQTHDSQGLVDRFGCDLCGEDDA